MDPSNKTAIIKALREFCFSTFKILPGLAETAKFVDSMMDEEIRVMIDKFGIFRVQKEIDRFIDKYIKPLP